MLKLRNSNTRGPAIAFCWLLFYGLLALPASGRPAEPVSIYVTVTEGDKLIGGLKHDNFRLFEGARSRDFVLAEPESPIAVHLLVEYSRSSYLYFNDLQAAVQAFMNDLPEGNWYALSTFASTMKVQVDFTKLAGRLSEAFSGLGPPLTSEVNTYDAVIEALDAMGRLPGRRVLILVGSGFDTFSQSTLDEVRKKVQSTNVTVYAVGAGSGLRGRYDPYLGESARLRLNQAQAFMQALADESGGEAWFPRFESAFYDVMKGVLQDIAFQYRLIYTPQAAADGKLHKIRVEAFQVVNDKRQDYKALSRVGWRF